MSTEFGAPLPAEAIPVRPKEKPETSPQRQQLPPYAVILHNDDINTFEYVVGVLQKVFKYPLEKAFLLTEETHVRGKSVVWSGSLEVAELKADQIRSCGPDPETCWRGAQPLRTTVEPQ